MNFKYLCTVILSMPFFSYLTLILQTEPDKTMDLCFDLHQTPYSFICSFFPKLFLYGPFKSHLYFPFLYP